MNTRVGVVSDTHGLLRPEVLRAFKRVDVIFHAGDIGDPDVLDQLCRLAPTIAVRGNNDVGRWAEQIPETKLTEVGAVSIYMLHDLKQLQRNAIGSVQAVISGHSHRPSIERRDGILFLNPGSAGPRRFKLPVSLGRLTIRGTGVSAELLDIV